MFGFWQFLGYYFGATVIWNLTTNTLLTLLAKTEAAYAKSREARKGRSTSGRAAS